jgi:hypothetical protein
LYYYLEALAGMNSSKSQVISARSLLSSVTNSSNQFDLRERLGPYKNASVREQVLIDLTSKSKRSLWALLESLVVYDDVFYDAHAFITSATSRSPPRISQSTARCFPTKAFFEIYTERKT